MTKQPSSLHALFAELKRRRVFRVMAMYGVVAFIVLQVADLVFPILELPDWTLQFVLMLTLLGFPIAIVIAWAFEATDQGIKRAEPASPELIQEIVALPASKRWPAGMLALLGMGLLFWSGWWMGNRNLGDGANILVPAAEASAFKAIAALPFENMNGDEDNRLIAMGIHDDLVNQLQRISALRVTGRTSVREYENTEKSFEQIAGELGVDYLLDGSYRRAGDAVRVNVALLDAVSGEQLWTEQYDESITPQNLFDIQSQIARRVVNALEAELTPQDETALLSAAPVTDLVARSWYQRAIEVYEASSLQAPEARDYLRRAVEIDSMSVAAWSRLAHMEARVVQIFGGDDAAALAARDRTIELAPGSVEAHLASGYVAYYASSDFDTALAAFREAERLAPSDSDVAWAIGLILRRQDDWDGSLEMFRKAVSLDPRNPIKLATLYENLYQIGAFEDAGDVADWMLSVAPSSPSARSSKVLHLVHLDRDTRRAHGLATELDLDTSEVDEAFALAGLAYLDRDYERMQAIVERADLDGVLGLFQRTWIAVATHGSVMAAASDSLRLFWPDEAEGPYPSWLRVFGALGTGRVETIRYELERAEPVLSPWPDPVQTGQAAGTMVAAYGAIGDLDGGFRWLEEIATRPTEWSSTMLRLSPIFDDFRDDPRFEQIIEKREAFEAEGARKAAAMRPWLP